MSADFCLAVEIQFLEFPLIQLSSSSVIIFCDSNVLIPGNVYTYPNNPSSKYTFTKYTIHSKSAKCSGGMSS